MIRLLEKQILSDINFVDRFVSATNSCIKDAIAHKFSSKDIRDALVSTGHSFEKHKNQYVSDIKHEEFVFRLIFDFKDDSMLTYIYVLKNGVFLDNGLSNFGFMLNEFDLTGFEINRKFGFNNASDLSEYLRAMVSIFDDFMKEFLKREHNN